MSPEFERSLKERIAAQVPYEAIESEFLAAGYSKEVIALAYAQVKGVSNTQKNSKVLTDGSRLFQAGFAIVKKRIDLILLLGVSSALLTLASVEGQPNESLATAGLISAVGVISLIVYVLGILASYYIVMKSSDAHEVSLKEGIQWAFTNIIPLSWLFFISAFVIIGGFVLLIVPGIILSLLIYFAYYAYVHEGQKGIAALLRSREVVYGRKWDVFVRLLIFVGYSFFISIVIALPYAVLEMFSIDEFALTVLVELVVQTLTAVVTLATIAAGSLLYVELAADRPAQEIAQTVRRKYQAIGIFGALATVGFLALATWAHFWLWDGNVPLINLNQTSELRSQVIFTEPIAEQYYTERGTYEGVCEVITQAVTLADEVVCNDTEIDWALAASIGDEYWCTDVTGYGKSIPGPLNQRSSCLNLPRNNSVEEEPAAQLIPEPDAASTTPETGEVIPMM